MSVEDRFPKIKALIGDTALSDQMRDVLLGRHGHTAEGLSDFLAHEGHPVSASTIRTYRRAAERADRENTNT